MDSWIREREREEFGRFMEGAKWQRQQQQQQQAKQRAFWNSPKFKSGSTVQH